MQEKKPGNYRWVVCSLLFFATTINYLDRQVVGYLKPTLELEFGWTETDYSHIVMAFTAAYAGGLLLFGRLIDRIGSKIGYTLSITIWSIAAMAHALVRSTLGFGFVRALLGLGESGNFPAAVKTVTEWFPKKERALATGFFDSGSNIGALLAPVIIPLLLSAYGWQAAFIITGAIGFLWLIAWRFFYEIPEKHRKLKAEELAYIRSDNAAEPETDTAEAPVKWFRLFGMKQTWAFIIGKFFTDPIWYFFAFWLPSYFSSTFHLDLKKPNLPLVLVYFGATVGAIGGGYLSSKLIKKGWPVYKARKIALFVSALAVLPIIATRYTDDMWTVVALIALAIAGNAAWSANIFTIVSDMMPKKAVSSVIGIGGMAGAVGGVLFPMMIGGILDYYKSINNITAGYNIIFIFCGLSFLIAWLLIHWVTPKMKPAKF
ncbi:MFS transporter [Nostoc ellipsosporum NOK]|jgi:ACS family hexuronate transporter-like MFS transporter|nr:MFS transporter [Nostoc ellipsosporum NOK]